MAALNRMRPRNRGTIVNVGSALAYRSVPLQSVYCGAKFAIRGFTDALRSEIIHDKLDVHLTMVDLPAMNTPQFDWALNKMGNGRSRSLRFSSPKWRRARSSSPRRIVGERFGWASRRSRRFWPTGSRRGSSTSIWHRRDIPDSFPTSRSARTRRQN